MPGKYAKIKLLNNNRKLVTHADMLKLCQSLDDSAVSEIDPEGDVEDRNENGNHREKLDHQI